MMYFPAPHACNTPPNNRFPRRVHLHTVRHPRNRLSIDGHLTYLVCRPRAVEHHLHTSHLRPRIEVVNNGQARVARPLTTYANQQR